MTMMNDDNCYVDPKLRLKGFNAFLGLRFGDISDEGCEVFCDLRPELLNPMGIAHGGLIATLTDVVAGTMALQIDRMERNIVTQSCHIHYLLPGTGAYLRARAELIRKGGRSCVVKTDCFLEDGRLCATATYEIAYLKTRKEDDHHE